MTPPTGKTWSNELEFEAVKDALICKLGVLCSDISDMKVWQFGDGKQGVMALAAALAKVNEIDIPVAPF